jgi:hypothetical protein
MQKQVQKLNTYSVLWSVIVSKNLCIGQYDTFFEEYCLLPIYYSFHHIGYPRYHRYLIYLLRSGGGGVAAAASLNPPTFWYCRAITLNSWKLISFAAHHSSGSVFIGAAGSSRYSPAPYPPLTHPLPPFIRANSKPTPSHAKAESLWL